MECSWPLRCQTPQPLQNGSGLCPGRWCPSLPTPFAHMPSLTEAGCGGQPAGHHVLGLCPERTSSHPFGRDPEVTQ